MVRPALPEIMVPHPGVEPDPPRLRRGAHPTRAFGANAGLACPARLGHFADPPRGASVRSLVRRESAESRLVASRGTQGDMLCAPEDTDLYEHQFRTVFETSASMMWLMDLQGHVLKINPLASNFSGTTPQSTVGNLLWEAGGWNHSPEIQAFVREAVFQAAAGQSVRRQTVHPQDGRPPVVVELHRATDPPTGWASRSVAWRGA